MLSASSTTPWLAAPSPKKLMPTRSSPFRRAASAAPVVIGACGPDDGIGAQHPEGQAGHVHGAALALAVAVAATE